MGENIGKIIQVMGPVVDVEFEQGKTAHDLYGAVYHQPRYQR